MAKEKIAGLQRYKSCQAAACYFEQQMQHGIQKAVACRENSFLLEEREILFRQLEREQLHQLFSSACHLVPLCLDYIIADSLRCAYVPLMHK